VSAFLILHCLLSDWVWLGPVGRFVYLRNVEYERLAEGKDPLLPATSGYHVALKHH
jgi:hypothetical protein